MKTDIESFIEDLMQEFESKKILKIQNIRFHAVEKFTKDCHGFRIQGELNCGDSGQTKPSKALLILIKDECLDGLLNNRPAHIQKILEMICHKIQNFCFENPNPVNENFPTEVWTLTRESYNNGDFKIEEFKNKYELI